VVGGGCNGVETIGYLADRIGNEGKKFGLCNRGPRLLPHFPVAASQAAEDSLRRMGVNIYLNTEYSEKTKKDLKYDHVIDCAGFRFKAPKEFLQGEMADCLDSKTG